MRQTIALLMLPLLGLTACGGPSDGSSEPVSSDGAGIVGNSSPAAGPQSQVVASSPPATVAAGRRDILSCAAEIGAPAAERLVDACRKVSPATHPPCNVANSCAMIEDEIARSCALFAKDGPTMADCAQPPDGMEAAADVVRLYYSALNAGDYDTAWKQWGENGAPGQTRAAFEAGFANTRKTSVTIGKLEPGSGGAGSIYQPVPVTIDAVLDDGTHQKFRGSYVVRRVNDVDGASAAQLRWHLGSARLKRVTAG